MSGHSHFATIKRQKEAKDAAKGKIFSKLSREITIAVKTGGGDSPDSNFKLRIVMDRARAANMPKANIERAIEKASGPEIVEEITYEGFGPGGFGVMVQTATDNRNRTGQEIKNIFEKAGGHFAGPGSVSFNFEPKGFILIDKSANTEEQMLKLIDLGVEDMEETADGIEAFVEPTKLYEIKTSLEQNGFTVSSTELIQKPKTLHKVTSKEEAAKVMKFLENLEEYEDVNNVFTNVDIPNELV